MEFKSQPVIDQKGHFEALNRMAKLDKYYEWAYHNIEPWIGKRILDVGSGIGSITHKLSDKELVILIDNSKINVEHMERVFRNFDNFKVLCRDILYIDSVEFQNYGVDTVICLNVLEHLKDDYLALQNIYKLLCEGGNLLLQVPALETLYGSMDIASGHFRRYNKHKLINIAEQIGFKVNKVFYMNIFGVLPWFIKSRILKKEVNFSRTLAPEKLDSYNKLMPIFEKIENIIPVPLGMSLIAIFKK